MNRLIFKGKEYELIETFSPKFIIYDLEQRYSDVGFNSNEWKDPYRYQCHSLHIGNKLYAFKLIENGK